jgi:2-amino-4-hydroxy-6-hydroxymethyldihydropteridine diphosphokinase
MEIYLSLGSNVGDRKKTILTAVELLANTPTFENIHISNFYITEPYGLSRQRDFVNCVLKLESSVSARELLNRIQEIELRLGRTRTVRWGERTIDIDILFFGDKIIQEPDLVIPHPGIQKRSFVLKPLCELCPDLIHPLLGRTIKSLWETISDESGSLWEL